MKGKCLMCKLEGTVRTARWCGSKITLCLECWLQFNSKVT